MSYNGSPEHRANILAAKQKSVVRQRELKNIRKEEYYKFPVLCKCCNGPIPYETKRTNKFCSSSCAATSRNTGSTLSEESKRKISIANKGKNRTKSKITLISCKCEMCSEVYELLPCKAKTRRFCTTACRIAWNKTDVGRAERSEIAKKRVVDGTHVGWKSRLGKPPSYPEQYFISLFDNEQIEYQREVKCGSFFIDFVVGKLAIEIDGSQHSYPDHIERDVRKDNHLRECGYTVVRIKWSNPKTQLGKDNLYPQIEALKELIK